MVKGHFTLDAATRLGFIALKVADLAAMIDWYQHMGGFAILHVDASSALLGTRANQQTLLSLRQINGVAPNLPVAGLAAFTVMIPTRSYLASLYEWQQQHGIRINAEFETGATFGFGTVDPEGNQVYFAYDRGSTQEVPRNYEWADMVHRPLQDKRRLQVAHEPFVELPPGAMLGSVTVRVQDLTKTIDYLTNVIGYTWQSTTGDTAVLTVGDAVYHHGMILQEEPQVVLPQAEHFGLNYLNIIVPSASFIRMLVANLEKIGADAYDYNDQHQYLMAAGPNRITLWFSVA